MLPDGDGSAEVGISEPNGENNQTQRSSSQPEERVERNSYHVRLQHPLYI